MSRNASKLTTIVSDGWSHIQTQRGLAKKAGSAALRYRAKARSAFLVGAEAPSRQRSVDCMADDNTAMRLAYATSASLAPQRYATLQARSARGMPNPNRKL